MPPDASYEFSAEEEKSFAALAKAMHRVGFWVALVGLLNLIEGAVEQIKPSVYAFEVIEGLLLFYIGLRVRSAAGSFAEIEKTKGKDIAHLMRGVDGLRTMFVTLDSFIQFIYLLLLASVIVGLIMVFRR